MEKSMRLNLRVSSVEMDTVTQLVRMYSQHRPRRQGQRKWDMTSVLLNAASAALGTEIAAAERARNEPMPLFEVDGPNGVVDKVIAAGDVGGKPKKLAAPSEFANRSMAARKNRQLAKKNHTEKKRLDIGAYISARYVGCRTGIPRSHNTLAAHCQAGHLLKGRTDR
jgi:hypothetical protein